MKFKKDDEYEKQRKEMMDKECKKCFHNSIFSPYLAKCPICKENLIYWNSKFFVKEGQPQTELYYWCRSCWRMFYRPEDSTLKMLAFKHDFSNNEEMKEELLKNKPELDKVFINQIFYLERMGTILAECIAGLSKIDNTNALDSNESMTYITEFILARVLDEVNERMLYFDKEIKK